MVEGRIRNIIKLRHVVEVSVGSIPTLSATIMLASRRPIASLWNLLRFGLI